MLRLLLSVLKPGVFTGDGPDYTGVVSFDSLQVPKGVYRKVGSEMELLSLTELKNYLPRRSRTAYKTQFGHILVIGGDQGMSGAVRLAAVAALRVGAGLVTLATHPDNSSYANIRQPELMCYGVNDVHELKHSY